MILITTTIQAFPDLPPAPLEGANLEFDVINHFYKTPNLTHAWNEFKLRPQVVDKVLSR